jgi:uncharacterized protein YyaL (SSP411 family)
MLYDQALLCQTYTEAALLTGNESYRNIAEEIITYILRDLTDPDGAFISAEDADSPGGEGAFYLWKQDELESVLGKPDAQFAMQVYALSPLGDPTIREQGPGAGILYCPKKPGETVPSPAIPGEEFRQRIESIRSRLFEARVKREPPSRDTKILANGNGLCIIALAAAWRAFGDPRCLAAANRAMDLILSRMRMSDGGLFHRYRDGEAAIQGFADDYAFVIRALLELYLSTFDLKRLSGAIELQRYFEKHFRDTRGGGFFSTSDNAERLLVRKKEIYDGVVPSSNSMALGNLSILSLLTGNPEFEKTALELSRAFSARVGELPSGYTGFLSSLDLLVNPATVVAVAGPVNDHSVPAMIRDLWSRYLPFVTTIWCRNDDPALTRIREDLMPFTRDLVAVEGKFTAYSCTGHRCSLPVTDRENLISLVGGDW